MVASVFKARRLSAAAEVLGALRALAQAHGAVHAWHKGQPAALAEFGALARGEAAVVARGELAREEHVAPRARLVALAQRIRGKGQQYAYALVNYLPYGKAALCHAKD